MPGCYLNTNVLGIMMGFISQNLSNTGISSFLNEAQFLINEVNADIAKEKHTLSLLRLKYGFDREKSSIGGSYI